MSSLHNTTGLGAFLSLFVGLLLFPLFLGAVFIALAIFLVLVIVLIIMKIRLHVLKRRAAQVAPVSYRR